MKLKQTEKIILLMLADIQIKLNIQSGSVDPQFIKDVIFSDNTWALSQRFMGLIGGEFEPPPQDVHEVSDVLEMWSFIEDAYIEFNADEKKRIEVNAAPYGVGCKFRGFDEKSERNLLSISRCFIDVLQMFSTFKDRKLNSHIPHMKSYQEMLLIFEPIRKTLGGRKLSVEEVIKLLKVMSAH